MNKKIRNIIIFLVIAVLGIVYSIFYILYPEATKTVSKDVLDYICEKPLPVIGISALTLGLIILRVISAVGLGKKTLNECKEELRKCKAQLAETTAAKEEYLAFEQRFDKKLQEFVEKHENNMRAICSSIPNRNVKELGEKFYGRKEENSDTAKD